MNLADVHALQSATVRGDLSLLGTDIMDGTGTESHANRRHSIALERHCATRVVLPKPAEASTRTSLAGAARVSS